MTYQNNQQKKWNNPQKIKQRQEVGLQVQFKIAMELNLLLFKCQNKSKK